MIEQMEKTVNLLKEQLTGIGVGNIDSNLISTVRILCDNQYVPLKHISSIFEKDRKISITPYNSSLLSEIENTLKKHGFVAYKFSKTTVVVNVPLPSREDCHKTNIQVKKLAEEAKISIRNIRKKYKNQYEEKEIKSSTDKYIDIINDLMNSRISN